MEAPQGKTVRILVVGDVADLAQLQSKEAGVMKQQPFDAVFCTGAFQPGAVEVRISPCVLHLVWSRAPISKSAGAEIERPHHFLLVLLYRCRYLRTSLPLQCSLVILGTTFTSL